MSTPTNHHTPTTNTTPDSAPNGNGADAGAATGGATATAAPKKKKPQKRSEIALYAVARDIKEVEKALKDGRQILISVHKPDPLKDPKHKLARKRAIYKPTIKAALGDTKSTPATQSEYGNRQIQVHSVHDTFKFVTKIEKVEHVNIEVNEG